MKSIAPATIIAIGLIVCGFLSGGRYTMSLDEQKTAIRLDRWTGEIEMCLVGADVEESCGWVDMPDADGSN